MNWQVNNIIHQTFNSPTPIGLGQSRTMRKSLKTLISLLLSVFPTFWSHFYYHQHLHSIRYHYYKWIVINIKNKGTKYLIKVHTSIHNNGKWQIETTWNGDELMVLLTNVCFWSILQLTLPCLIFFCQCSPTGLIHVYARQSVVKGNLECYCTSYCWTFHMQWAVL